MKYIQYLKSSKWKTKRDEYERIGNCYVCNRRRHLQLHHISYKNLGNEGEDDLVVVCEACHTRIHAFVKHQGVELVDAHLRVREYVNKDSFGFDKNIDKKQNNFLLRKLHKDFRKRKYDVCSKELHKVERLYLNKNDMRVYDSIVSGLQKRDVL